MAALEAEEEEGRERRRREPADAMDLPSSVCSSSAASPAAAAVTIRRFQPGDAPAVRALVASGRAGAATGRYVSDRLIDGWARVFIILLIPPHRNVCVSCAGRRSPAFFARPWRGTWPRWTPAMLEGSGFG